MTVVLFYFFVSYGRWWFYFRWNSEWFHFSEFLIHKENSIGTVIWSKSFGDGADAILRSMTATDDGNYIMLGEINDTDDDFTIHYGSSGNADIAVIKIDSEGNKLWSKVLGGTGYQWAACVVPAFGGGCFVIGTTNSNDYDCSGNHGGNSGSNDAYLAKLDGNGNLIWHKDLGGIGIDGGKYGWPEPIKAGYYFLRNNKL